MVKSAPSTWSPNARPRMAKDGVVHRVVESLRIEFRSGVVGLEPKVRIELTAYALPRWSAGARLLRWSRRPSF
jgi:hypothetical protein